MPWKKLEFSVGKQGELISGVKEGVMWLEQWARMMALIAVFCMDQRWVSGSQRRGDNSSQASYGQKAML